MTLIIIQLGRLFYNTYAKYEVEEAKVGAFEKALEFALFDRDILGVRQLFVVALNGLVVHAERNDSSQRAQGFLCQFSGASVRGELLNGILLDIVDHEVQRENEQWKNCENKDDTKLPCQYQR